MKNLLLIINKKKISVKWVFAPILLTLITIFICNWKIEDFTHSYVFDDVHTLPDNEVGLVLGTSKYLVGGGVNPYFKYRIEAAANLYKAGKIKYILVSGDNNTIHYNEPRDMKNELVKMGVPSDIIYMDFAGFRTLDSVIRCKNVFGQDKFTVISQGFHTKRAVFISRKTGIEAIGYQAQDVPPSKSLNVQARELLARVKVFIDLYITKKQPKFLGKPVSIG